MKKSVTKSTTDPTLNKYKLSTGRSILLTLSFITFITAAVYFFAPSQLGQTILLGTALVLALAIIIFAISKIGRKTW